MGRTDRDLFMVLSQHFLEGHGSLGQDIAINQLDSNSGSHEYEAGVLAIPSSICDYFVLSVNVAADKSTL
jgi:hypothetical protein